MWLRGELFEDINFLDAVSWHIWVIDAGGWVSRLSQERKVPLTLR